MIEVRRDAVSVARLSKPRVEALPLPKVSLGSSSHDGYRSLQSARSFPIWYARPGQNKSRGRSKAGVAVDAEVRKADAVPNDAYRNTGIRTGEFVCLVSGREGIRT